MEKTRQSAGSLPLSASRIFSFSGLNMLFIFLFAFGVRYLFLHVFSDDPFFRNPIFDAEFYDRWARAIAAGDWLGSGVFFVSPLYAYFLAVLYIVFHHSLYSVILVQMVLGAVNCVLIYLIGRKLFNEIAGICASLLASLYGYFLFLESQLLKNSLAYLMSTLSFYLFLLAEDRKKPVWWAALGLSIGITSLIIPNFLLFLPVLCAYLILKRRDRKSTLRAVLALSLGMMIIAPVTLRNYFVGGDLVLVSSNGGINLFLGTDPNTDGGMKASPLIKQAPDLEEQSSRQVAELILRRPLSPSQVSRFWASMAVRNLTRDLPAAFRLLGTKIYNFWNWRELTDNLDYYYFTSKYPILGIVQFGLIVPLSFFGMWLSRKRERQVLPAYVFIITFMISCLPFAVFGRYRTPVVPLLMIFAGYGISQGWSTIRQRQWKELGIGLAVFIIVLAAVNNGARGHNSSFMYRALGEIYIGKADFASASLALKKAVKENPESYYAHNSLGFAELRMGNVATAIKELQIAIRLNPSFGEAHNNLGMAYQLAGKRLEAEEEFEKARELDAAVR